MAQTGTIADWLAAKEMTLAQLIESTALEDRIVQAIAAGRFTPSPEQRRRIAAALGIEPEQIACGHFAQVSHVYGHGPQFGRSP